MSPQRTVKRRTDVAFLFLGEMLLVPHMWPIVDCLARLRPDLVIDLWVSTSSHEALIGSWLNEAHANVRLRRAPGYRYFEFSSLGENPPLPPKLSMLARLAIPLSRVRVVVCAEQTSLWLPRVVPGIGRFIFTTHGAGAPNYNRDGRLRCADRLLFSSDLHDATHLAHGIRQERIVATGYVKSAFTPSLTRQSLFADDRPILLYTPHWQRYRSSWWDWGRDIVDMLVAQDRFNVILAPHQRLHERDLEVAAILERAAKHSHVHADIDSFAMVDGSYTNMADIYLGDSSSQLLEYIAKPRPAVLLDSPNMSWRTPDQSDYWRCGDIIKNIAELPAALDSAIEHFGQYRASQELLAFRAFGNTDGRAAQRAAEVIVSRMVK